MAKLKARVGVGAAATVAVILSQPGLLTSRAGAIALGIVFLAGTISPERVSPKTVELAQKAGAWLSAMVNAPKEARAAKEREVIAKAVDAGKAAGLAAGEQIVSEMLKHQTGQWGVGQLGSVVSQAAMDALAAESAKLAAEGGA